MSNNANEGQPAGLTLADVYFVLFRHKKKIILLSFLGLAAGLGYFFLRPQPYQSEAFLSVDSSLNSNARRVPTANGQEMGRQNNPAATEMLIGTEMEVLGSFDVCLRAATNMGPEKILARLGGGKDPTVAASAIQGNLVVERPKGTSLIHVVLKHPDPRVVQLLLQAVIEEYQSRDKEIHNDLTQVDKIITEKTTELANKVAAAEDALKRKMSESGVISAEDELKALTAAMASTRADINKAEADLAERQMIFRQIVGTNSPVRPVAAVPATTDSGTNAAGNAAAVGGAGTNTAAAVANVPPSLPEPPDSKLQEYRTITNLYLSIFTERERATGIFAPESSEIRKYTRQIEDLERKRAALVSEYPKLAMPPPSSAVKSATPFPGSGSAYTVAPPGSIFDTNREASLIEGIKTRIQQLKFQYDDYGVKATNLSSVYGAIAGLQKNLVVQQALHQQYVLKLQEIRTETEFYSRDLSHNTVAESPTPPRRDPLKAIKISAGLLFAGIGGGLAWAFLLEMVLDHTVKRAKDIEGQLGLQVLLSFPRLGRKQARQLADHARLQITNGEGDPAATDAAAGAGDAEAGGAALALRNHNAALQTYYEALRDRLISYFDVRNLTHKPKLVAVTGAGTGVGTSTIAVGLAASLSETGEGNVLLVDMNQENGAAHQFFKGKLSCELNEALEDGTRETAFIQKNLYVATGSANRDKLPRILPKRFANLLPKLKASDYDYIIFDMPPISQTSVTPRLAGFMDIVLMVVESEKTNRDVVHRANAMLAESKANVKVVLNKTQIYVPARLVPE